MCAEEKKKKTFTHKPFS